MKFYDYVKWTENTCAKLEDLENDNLHMIFGVLTEIGELIDIFKKNLAYKKEIDWVNVAEEVGDCVFYLASFCRINNIDLENSIDVDRRTSETSTNDVLLKMIVEIGELSELLDTSRSFGIFDNDSIEYTIANLMYYLASFCNINNLNLVKIIETNVKKLESRYPEKFTEYYANNRDLQKEREILEK